MRRYIGHEYPIKDFINITSNFSFKYFIIKFYSEKGEVDFIMEEMSIVSFKIDYAFSLISEIIDEMVLEYNDLFFDKGIYKEHTGSTIGGYFELIVIEKIKKKLLALPNNNYEYIINVDKICEMNRINNLIINNLELFKNEIEVKQKENNLLNNDENADIDKNTNLLQAKNYIKDKDEDYFDYKIHPSFEKSEIINFEANYLVQKSTIDEIKNSFIKDNNVRFYNDSEKLLFSSRLFGTSKDKVIKVFAKTSNDINNNYHFLKDKNLLITKFYANAETFDLGYLYGKSDKKVFIGFQIKSYKDY